jgi:hypothetical protein
MNLAFTNRVLEKASPEQIRALIAAIKEGRDEMRARVDQCQEHDAGEGMSPLMIELAYAKDEATLRFLSSIDNALTDDLDTPNAASVFAA